MKENSKVFFLFCLCLIFKIRLGLVTYSETSNCMHDPPQDGKEWRANHFKFCFSCGWEEQLCPEKSPCSPLKGRPGGMAET